MGRCQRFVSEYDLRRQNAIETGDDTTATLGSLGARPHTSVGISDARLSRAHGAGSPCVHADLCRPCSEVWGTLMVTVALAAEELTLLLLEPAQSVGAHPEALEQA